MNSFPITTNRRQPQTFTRLKSIVIMLLIGLGIALAGTVMATQPAYAQNDTTPPIAAPTPNPPPNLAGWNNSDVTVTWNWLDETGGSGIDPNNCTFTSTSSGEGIMDLTSTCADLASNISTAGYTVQVDKTAPETVFTVAPQTTINLVEVTFEFGGSDALSGVAGFECKLDSVVWTPCTSPKTYTFFPVKVTHTFEARAIDAAGNVDPTPISHTWLTNPQPALIRIVQDTVPDGPKDFVYNATHNTNSFIPGTFVLDDDGQGPPFNLARFTELVKGTYIFTQTATGGYSAPSISCTDPSGGTTVSGSTATIHALFGETIECIFTNDLTDATPPTATPNPTLSPAANAAGWHNSDVTATWNWTDNAGGTGVDPNNCPSATSSGEGTATVNGTCADLGGNVGSANTTVQVDKTPPDTVFTVAPQTTINLVEMTFEFGGSDDRSGVAGFECRLDSVVWSPCTSPKTYTLFPVKVTHTFEARAIDAAGNADPTPISHTWLTNPQPALIRIVQDTVPDGPQDFVYNATHNTNSFIPATFVLDDDGQGPPFNLARFTELVKGTYIFTQTVTPGYSAPAISCTDPSGGTTVSGSTATIHALFGETVECIFTNNLTDTTPPTASPSQSPPANAAGWNNSDVTVSWNWADETGGSGLDTNNCTASSTSSGEGSIDLTATCSDLVGNSGSASRTLQVDKTAPDTTITANPANPSSSSDVTFAFSGSDALSGVASLECQLDGGGFNPCTSPQTYTGLSNGSHTFEVRASDVADNVDGSPASYTWTVDAPPADTTAPTANPTQSPVANAAGWNNSDVTITWNWADETGGSGINPANCTTSSISSGEGTINLTATCADLAGNVGSASRTLQVDKTAPDTAISANPPATSTSADATFEFSGSDATSGVASLECQLDGGGYSPCTSPQNFTGLANGSHTFEVRAIDQADNTDQSPASYIWTVSVNVGPSVNAGSDQTIILPASASLSGSANDDGLPNLPGALSVQWSQVSGPGTTTFADANSVATTASFSTNGMYVLRLTVHDGELTAADDVTIRVNPAANQAPVAVGEAFATTEDTLLTVHAPGVLSNDSDMDGNPMTAVEMEGSSNGTLDLKTDGSFTYTPNANFNGSDSFTYRANDGTDNSNIVTVTIIVNPVNDALTLSATNGSTTINEGDTATNGGILSNVDSHPVTLTATVGTVINNNDGTWLWSFKTSNGPSPDSQIVTIAADDSNGNNIQTSFYLTVNNVAPQLGSIVGTQTQMTLGDTITVQSTFSTPGTGDSHTGVWDWGDGSTSVATIGTGVVGLDSHTYATGGTYTIKLTVIDDDGGQSEQHFQVTVVDNLPETGVTTLFLPIISNGNFGVVQN